MKRFYLTIALLLVVHSVHKMNKETIPAVSGQYKAVLIREAHAKGGLMAPTPMFAAQIHQESGWNPNAKSAVGAQGLTQFMPATATWISKMYPKDLPGAASLDPHWAIRALVYYDYWLHNRLPMYIETDENRWASSLSGYNGGLGNTLKDAKLGHCNTWWNCAEFTDDGRSAASLTENRNYPRRIVRILEPLYKQAGWN